MTSATPKPRAGEHTWHDDKMLIFALREENDAIAAQLEEARGLAHDVLAGEIDDSTKQRAKDLLAKARPT